MSQPESIHRTIMLRIVLPIGVLIYSLLTVIVMSYPSDRGRLLDALGLLGVIIVPVVVLTTIRYVHRNETK